MSVARHTLYNFLGAIVPVAMTLISTPLYLNAIGIERYGVLALAWVLAGYFTFFDFGLGRALAQRLASLARESPKLRSRTFWSGLSLSVVLSAIAAIVFALVAERVMGSATMSPALRRELDQGIPVLIFALPIAIIQSLLMGSLEGRRAFGQLNLATASGTILTALLPLLVAVTLGPQLPGLIAAVLAARVVTLLALSIVCRRAIPLNLPHLLDRHEIIQLLRFGSWTTVTAVVGPVLVYFDRFAIGALLGSAAVAYYVVAFNLIANLQALPSSLSRAIAPRIAELGDEGSLGTSNDGILLIAALATPISIAAILLSGPFFALWLGKSIAAQSTPVAVVLLLGYWTNSIAFVPFARLQSIGRPDIPARIHLAEMIPYLALLWFSVNRFGLIGAAAVWAIRCTSDLAAMLWFARTHGRFLLRPAVGAILVVVSAAIALSRPGLIELLLSGLVLGLIGVGTAWWMLPSKFHQNAMAIIASLRRMQRREV